MLSERSVWKHRPERARGCFFGPWLTDGSRAKMICFSPDAMPCIFESCPGMMPHQLCRRLVDPSK